MDSSDRTPQPADNSSDAAPSAAALSHSSADQSAAERSAQYREQLAQRYPDRKKNTFSGKILVVTLAVVMAAALAYAVTQFGRNSAVDVSAIETGGRVVSDSKLTASIDVTRSDPSKAAYCILTALDYDKNEVGRREFVIPAGGESVSRFEVDIETREVAYAATVYGCSTVLPPHLDGGE